jgi:hypothetical protein
MGTIGVGVGVKTSPTSIVAESRCGPLAAALAMATDNSTERPYSRRADQGIFRGIVVMILPLLWTQGT